MNQDKHFFKSNRELIHGLIAVILIIVVSLALKPVDELTDLGRITMGVLVASLYLWNTVNKIWDNLFMVVALGFAGTMSMNASLAMYWGSPVILQYFCMMILMTNLVKHNIPAYIGDRILKIKALYGRPWLFTFALMVFAYLLSLLIGPFAPLFLLWPMSYGIFRDLGYSNSERYPKFLLVNIIMGAMLGFATPIYLGYTLGLNLNFQKIMESLNHPMTIASGPYLLIVILMSLLVIALTVLAARFLLRVDVTKLRKLDADVAQKNALPPMSPQQKSVSIVFTVYLVIMVLPNFLPKVGPIKYLASMTTGISLLAVIVMMAMHVEGKPLLDLNAISGEGFPWAIFLRSSSALMLGTILTMPESGMIAFVENRVAPLFSGMEYTVFAIVFSAIVIILSNVFSNMIVSMLLQPIPIIYCLANGINPVPLSALTIYLSLSTAALLPAGSAFSLALFKNKEWLSAKDAVLYGGITVLIIFLVSSFVGFPLANLLF